MYLFQLLSFVLYRPSVTEHRTMQSCLICV